MSDKIKALGGQTEYHYDGQDASLLERFPSPMNLGAGAGKIEIMSPEFTSLCPITGQPDFARIVVEYIPKAWCVESKSWKLYLGSYRQAKDFHEACVRRIANDLIKLLDPEHLVVRGEFTPRGGIPFWPTVAYKRPELVLEMPDEFKDDAPLPKPVIAKEMQEKQVPHLLLTKNKEVIGYARQTAEGLDVSDYRKPFEYTTVKADDA